MSDNKSPFSFPASNATTTTNTTGSLFGNASNAPNPAAPTTFAFGNINQSNQSSDKSPAPSLFGGASTPAANKSLFNVSGSTTPSATPPPGTTPKPLFGAATAGASSGGGLFSNLSKPAATSVSTPPAPTLFGNQSTSKSEASTGLFNVAPSNATSSNAASTPLFGTAPTKPISNAPQAPAATTSGLFNNMASSSTPAASLFTTAAKKNPPESNSSASTLFGAKPSSSSVTPSASSLFGAKPAAEATLAPSTTTTTTSTIPSLFPSSAATATTTATTTTSPNAPIVPPSMGFNVPKTTPNSQAQSSAITTTKATDSAATTSAPGGFSLFGKPGTATGAATNETAKSGAPMTSSNAMSQQTARLKNKSMDEILTRWATDLTKYQKEFQKQAEQVAEWDRLLVDNTDKISKLVTKTIQAERDASELEKQLSHVEGQQEELSQWLDKYDKEIDDMITKVGLGNDNGGVDVERERTFKLAEKLTDRIEDYNTNLTDMIEEINSVSSLLSNTSGTDDPLSHVVRVLNSHLVQLQQIDQDSTKLQAQVQEAQKKAKALGGNDWRIGSNPAEDFYKSLRR